MPNIEQLLGEEAGHLLKYRCAGIPKESLHLPGPDYVDRVVAIKDRKRGVLRSLQALYGQGRWPIRVICHCCLWIRAWNIPPVRRSPPIRSTSTPTTSCNSLLKAVATAWLPRSGCWARWRAAMRTRSLSS